MYKIFFLYFFLIIVHILIKPVNSSTLNNELKFIKNSSKHICKALIGKEKLNIEWNKVSKNYKTLYHKKTKFYVSSSIFQRQNKINLITLTFKLKAPIIQLRLDKNCNFQNIRIIIYDNRKNPISINTLSNDFKTTLSKQEVNPTFNHNLKMTNNNLIALVDTGVNYTLTKLVNNLAIDKHGKIIGYDFWDDDNFPFDSDPRRNPFYPRHHGTAVFSVLKNEAPNTNIGIYRFPALKMCKFKDLIEEIVEKSFRIVNLSMGSKNRNDWECFFKSIKKYKNLIFVVSAGNDKQDIDINPIYPASFKLKNIIVVSSSTKNGQLGRDSNFGAENVDFLLPAENVSVIDHRGVNSYTGGTSYAVPRMSALISRYLTKNQESSIDDVLNFLKKRSITTDKTVSKYGWIPDPSDDYLIN